METNNATGMVRLAVAGTVEIEIAPDHAPGARPVGLAVTVSVSGEYPESGVTTSQAGVEEGCAHTTVELAVPAGSVTMTLLAAGRVELPT